MHGCNRELINFLSKKPEPLNIVVTPDFFMDRLIDLDYDPEHFSSEVAEIVERKGGSIDQVSQTDQRGGNAINVASALLALGAKVTPIVCTSKMGIGPETLVSRPTTARFACVYVAAAKPTLHAN